MVRIRAIDLPNEARGLSDTESPDVDAETGAIESRAVIVEHRIEPDYPRVLLVYKRRLRRCPQVRRKHFKDRTDGGPRRNVELYRAIAALADCSVHRDTAAVRLRPALQIRGPFFCTAGGFFSKPSLGNRF